MEMLHLHERAGRNRTYQFGLIFEIREMKEFVAIALIHSSEFQS